MQQMDAEKDQESAWTSYNSCFTCQWDAIDRQVVK